MIPKVRINLFIFPCELVLPGHVFPHLVHDLVALQIIAFFSCFLCLATNLTPEERLAGLDIELFFAFLNRGSPVRGSSCDLMPRVFSDGYPLS